MRLRFAMLLALLALSAFVLTGCPPVVVSVPPDTAPASQPVPIAVDLANPSATFCLDMGYTYQVRQASDGSQYGVCIFPAPAGECDGWAYFRGECGPADRTYDLASDEALYCLNQGYMLEVRANAYGQFGVCFFPDGSQCAADAFLAGLCGPQPDVSVAVILGAEVEAPADEAEAEEAVAEEVPEGEAEAEEAAEEAAEGVTVTAEAGEGAVAADGGVMTAPVEDEVMADEPVVSVVNVVAAAGLLGATQVDVLAGDGEIASIDDADDVQALVDALNTPLQLMPRDPCVSTYTLRFHLGGGAVQTFGYACGSLDGARLRGDQAFWVVQDVMATEGFNELMAGHLAGLDP